MPLLVLLPVILISVALPTFVIGQNKSLDTSTWMGRILPLLDDRTTLLDLSLPGTHDTMTYDLSEAIADNTNDIPAWLSDILHLVPDVFVGKFVRDQAKTQGATITQQLDAGIRFIDFRITYSLPANSDAWEWVCVHFMETNLPALTYLQQIASWLDAHPDELLVFEVSRHGDTCLNGSTEYPGTTPAIRQAFWQQIVALFGHKLWDFSKYSMGSTSLREVYASGARVVMLMADWADFTGRSVFSVDGCRVIAGSNCNGPIGPGKGNVKSFQAEVASYATMASTNAAAKRNGHFQRCSTALSSPPQQIEYAALLDYQPFDRHRITKDCTEYFSFPNMTSWCPTKLQEISQLMEYYNARVFEHTFQLIAGGSTEADFPNAIYTDAVDTNGCIRTGTQLFPVTGAEGAASLRGPSHATTGYAYVGTLVMANLYRLCKPFSSPACQAAAKETAYLRAQCPLTLWDDTYGRSSTWPPLV